MFDKKILNIYSIIIGTLFIVSGIGKVIDTAGFSNLIYQYGLGYLMILSPIIVLVEILLGLFLILLINPKQYSFVSFVLLIIFTIAFAYAHFRYGVNNCGCFGTIQHSNLPPIFSFLRNLILIVMSFIVWIKYPKEKTKITLWKKYVIFSVMGISLFIAGLTFRIPFFLTGKPKTHAFQNQNIKNTELSNYIKTAPDSTYLVFCFSYTCPYCLNSIENLRQYEKTNTADNVMALAVGDPEDRVIFEQNFNPDFAYKDLSVEEMDKLTSFYPTAFYVVHDTIKVIVQGQLPSPFVFKESYLSPKEKKVTKNNE
jgi:uncharacterized membrane protein YphA (DoxX/SURF4 family)